MRIFSFYSGEGGLRVFTYLGKGGMFEPLKDWFVDFNLGWVNFHLFSLCGLRCTDLYFDQN